MTEKTHNLYELLKDENKVKDSNPEHEANFQDLKKGTSKLNKRYLPDYKKELLLECDALSIGVSAILYQIGEMETRK